MFFIPSYVTFFEEDGAVLITSNLRRNTVKLTDPEVISEFKSIASCGGCPLISTPLSRFLHDQELLVNDHELIETMEELHQSMNSCLLLTVMPTEGCNFRCPYCYEDHKPVSMSRKTLDWIQEYITKQAPNFQSINISWFGGEPTLCCDNILETAALMQSLQEVNSFSYTSNMTTNGYLLDREHFIRYYQAGITSYQITLDGWKHDKTRPHVSGKGTLNKILENLTAISALSQENYIFEITLRHNILPGDEDYSWYDHLHNLFGRDQRFSVLVRPVSDWGGESVHSFELLEGDTLDSLMQKHIDYLRKIGMKCGNGKTGVLSHICYASYPNSMVFRASGKIEKCTTALDHPQNCIGYVDPNKGVIIDEEANHLWSDLKLNEECYHCGELLSCLNLHCRKPYVFKGEEITQCPNKISRTF